VLHDRDVFNAIKTYVTSNRPYFGIGGGMEILFESLEVDEWDMPAADHELEFDVFRGLSVIPGKVIKLNNREVPVPHIGWNSLNAKNYAHFLTSPGSDVGAHKLDFHNREVSF
jgi:imidazoleglycerol phosphate synthase glutamine amidotransferase subunit HisH